MLNLDKKQVVLLRPPSHVIHTPYNTSSAYFEPRERFVRFARNSDVTFDLSTHSYLP